MRNLCGKSLQGTGSANLNFSRIDAHPAKIRKKISFQTLRLRMFVQKFSTTQIFSTISLHSDNESLVSEMQNKLGVTDFVSGAKRFEKYLDFKKSSLVTRGDLNGSCLKCPLGVKVHQLKISICQVPRNGFWGIFCILFSRPHLMG